MKIIYKDTYEKNEEDYQKLCITELDRLEAFSVFWEGKTLNTIGLKTASYSSATDFAKCGIIQTAIVEYAFFGANCEENRALYLRVRETASWKDVYDILVSIERIALD